MSSSPLVLLLVLLSCLVLLLPAVSSHGSLVSLLPPDSSTALVLGHQVAVFIPSTVCPTPSCPTCVSWPCFPASSSDLRSLRDETLTVLSSCFGGGFCHEVTGAWLSEATVELVLEDNVICRSFSTLEQAERGLPRVIDHIRMLGMVLGQEMMALQVDGELRLVRPYSGNCTQGTLC